MAAGAYRAQPAPLRHAGAGQAKPRRCSLAAPLGAAPFSRKHFDRGSVTIDYANASASRARGETQALEWS